MSHYFTSDDAPLRRRTLHVDLWGHQLEVSSADGVFARDAVDKGTAVLLRHELPTDAATRFLDVGCGWGPLTLALAHDRHDAHVTAIDVNDAALTVCAENAAATGVAERVRVCRPEDVSVEAEFDEIWSNPPIRIGKQALHELLLTWLPRLTPGGVARLVVSKNLGADSLQAWLIGQGHPCVRAASSKGFRVLRVGRQGDKW